MAPLLPGAISEYKGNFLAGNDSSRVISTLQYYQTRYLDVPEPYK